MFLKAKAMFSSILAAIPDLSKTVPIKINNGTARSVTLFMMPNILKGILLKIAGSKTPNGIHIKANKMDIPDKVNATG